MFVYLVFLEKKGVRARVFSCLLSITYFLLTRTYIWIKNDNIYFITLAELLVFGVPRVMSHILLTDKSCRYLEKRFGHYFIPHCIVIIYLFLFVAVNKTTFHAKPNINIILLSSLTNQKSIDCIKRIYTNMCYVRNGLLACQS